MFPRRYFPARMFAPRYFPPVIGDDTPPAPAPDLAMSSVLIQQSRRLFMEDEEIIIL